MVQAQVLEGSPGSDRSPRFVSHLQKAGRSVQVEDIFEASEACAETLVGIMNETGRRRLILSGSGDSLFAAQSAAPAMRAWSGEEFRTFTSIEAARYEMPAYADDAILIAVSNSGGSTRTRESVAIAKALGIPSIGIVGSLDGPLAETADIVLHRPVALVGDQPDWSPRVYLNAAEYLAALTSLFALGLFVGGHTGHVPELQISEAKSRIAEALLHMEAAAAACDPITADLAQSMDGIETVFVLGAGPGRGTADYSAAKFHEQVPLNGVPQDLEEWAHLQYFLTLNWREKAIVIVLASRGASADRAAEMLTGIKQAGGRAILATD
ncbi:MAG: SIS domain-containing protein, partial [Pseudomonadota bacterium]